jgi:RimJ/RimL family protein N-acetyltransferase
VPIELETERLILRQWQDADRDDYYAMNADPEVRRFFPSTQTREESDSSLDNIRRHLATHNWGLWAVEVKATGELAGLTGLWPMPPGFPAEECTEVGWRLAKAHWGKGYAPEGARAALAHAFTVLELPQVVSMTTMTNQPSRRVMEKLGMTRNPADDFVNPSYPDWWGGPHVLYRITAERYRALTAAS